MKADVAISQDLWGSVELTAPGLELTAGRINNDPKSFGTLVIFRVSQKSKDPEDKHKKVPGFEIGYEISAGRFHLFIGDGENPAQGVADLEFADLHEMFQNYIAKLRAENRGMPLP
jgi:hypothetical protein